MHFEFATATRIVFGESASDRVPSAAKDMGKRALLVTGAGSQRAQPLREQLTDAGVHVASYTVDTEPTIETVGAVVRQAREMNCDLVIGFGGGSVLDTGKAVAALLTNGGEPLDYLEVIGQGKRLTAPAVPYIAIPTTAGTGAEVTRNAVLASPKHQVKASLRSPLMLPRLAVVDPQLTHDLPPNLTASTGLDALTQLLEPFVSRKANAMTDAFCREGLRRVASCLLPAVENGNDAAAREGMALASLFGGLALANAKLGAVHGIAGPLGGMFPAPHGAACAALLPHVMAVNVEALKEREPESEALQRYQEVACLLTRSKTATVIDGVTWLLQLCQQLNIPSLGTYGFTESHFPDLIARAFRASSMTGNPIQLRNEELREILTRAL